MEYEFCMGKKKMELPDEQATYKADLLDAELLSTVSHELRSPLASIKGYTITLLRYEQRISRKERHEFLVAINQASDRLEGVINRLLELSALETGKVHLMLTSVHLPHLIQEAIIAREQYTQNKPLKSSTHRFRLRLEGTWHNALAEEQVIMADRQRMREVLDHLLENATLYSSADDEIEIVLRPATPAIVAEGKHHSSANNDQLLIRLPQPMVEILVRDHGIGIPPEHIERIFHRFHRVDTSLTREVNGLGLGLAICKNIVELHHGLIWAESEPGHGSTFHVLLPITSQEEYKA